MIDSFSLFSKCHYSPFSTPFRFELQQSQQLREFSDSIFAWKHLRSIVTRHGLALIASCIFFEYFMARSVAPVVPQIREAPVAPVPIVDAPCEIPPRFIASRQDPPQRRGNGRVFRASRLHVTTATPEQSQFQLHYSLCFSSASRGKSMHGPQLIKFL